MRKQVAKKKVIILGIDAMDPNITEQLMQEGQLPWFLNLKTIGAYSHLQTTVPADSVTAWSTFITGLNPGNHGIFGFLMRDPKNYRPFLPFAQQRRILGKIKFYPRRQGSAFWTVLSENRIPSYIYFCPNTYPPEMVQGKMFSGMGVPDILGTLGTYSFYTTQAVSKEDRLRQVRIIYVEIQNNTINTAIYGPAIYDGKHTYNMKIPLRLILHPEEKKAYLEFQRNRLTLEEGSWSGWQEISFKVSAFRKIHGILKFYLKSINPDLQLYMSPINFDPRKPYFPISYPKSYSRALAKKIGLYYTQGLPYDTQALKADRLDESGFLKHADEIFKQSENILKECLKEFNEGVFFFYFEILDIIQHMFWRYIDPQHPLFEKDSPFKNIIFRYYKEIDQIIGDILKDLGQDTTMIVLSDHGFGPSRKLVSLNRWLLENGYLFLKKGKNESKKFFEDVDWSKTKAYALGYGGIYLNKVFREYCGIINESETKALRQALIIGLKQFRDPVSAEEVVRDIYTKEEVFRGRYINSAPDLYVGFNAGYRESWESAVGIVDDNKPIEENRTKWSGDHFFDPGIVPGVIFVNKKVELISPSIIDIAPTVLGLFGIDKLREMEGKVLFK